MRWELLVTLGALWACGGNARENTASGGASSTSHAGATGDPSVSSSTAGGATSAGGTAAGGTATSTAPQGAAGTSVSQAGSNSGVSCNLNGTPPTYSSPASGNIAGPNIDVTFNPVDADAYLEHTPGSYAVAAGYWVSINASTPANSATSTNFQQPANATGGLLTVFVEVNSATPGTYASTGLSRCSGVAYCARLPIPSSVNCANVTGSDCPAGCSVQGPVMGPSCQPVTPELCYSADGAMTCMGETPTPQGSWSLTLTSVTPCSDNPNPSMNITDYVVHGSFTANLVGYNTDATDTATLTMVF